MADESIDNLKKLSALERVQKLRELEKKHKQQIEEVEKMISQSVAELEDQEFRRQKVPIPQLAADEEGTLTSEEEKRMFRTQRFMPESPARQEEENAPAPQAPPGQQSLEQMAEEAETRERGQASQAGVSYNLATNVRQSAESIYDAAKELEERREQYGTLNQQARQQVETMQEQVERLRGYEADTQTKGLLEAERGMLERMATAQQYSGLRQGEARKGSRAPY